MDHKICPQCGTANPESMSFCSNCGQSLRASGENQPRSAQEPPPTVFIGQTPQQQRFEQPKPAFSAPPPTKKGGKGWIFAVAGCLGLLIVSVVGLGILAFVFGTDMLGKKSGDYPTPKPNTNAVLNSKQSDSDSTNSKTDLTNSFKSDDNTDSSSTNLLVKILEARKTVGPFNQTYAKSLVTKDYFPLANEAAQAEYSNGSNNVYLTVGKFDSLDVAKRNFNDQIQGVKSGGGKITYQNTAADGTISAIYNNKGYYFAEYCNTNNFCNRIHSDSQSALKSFFENYAK